ncbi:MAG: type II secretion system protein GspI [Gammaproteobacteria bacterium]|nr:type II secretion system protein GspI [Gammaproteobacteria bacterium]
MRCPEPARGFTLIEVVVALAIVAIGMLAVFRVIGDTTASVEYLRDRTLAGWIADNRITEMRGSGDFPSIDETRGELEFAGRRWHWVAAVAQTPVDGLRRIDVRVRRDGDPEDSALATVTGFIGAAASSSAPAAAWLAGATDPPEEGDD